MVGLSPVEMSDGRELHWYPPQPVVFNLLEAHRYAKRGVKSRVNIMAKLKKREGGSYAPGNPTTTLNCVRDLQVAVSFAFTAIENLANHSIDMLDDEFVLKRRRRDDLPKKDLIRSLSIEDKYKLVVPRLDQGENIAGTAAWEAFLRLKVLRDELVHFKHRGGSADPKERMAYDRLLLGDADHCTEDALAVIQGAFPGFIPDHVLKDLEK